MKVWRIGSNWGGNDILSVFKDYSIAFAGVVIQEMIKNAKVGDLIAVTSGQTIKAIGRITGQSPLAEYEEEFVEDYDDVIALSIEPYFFADDFKIDFGTYQGRGKQFHEAHNGYRKLIIEHYNNLICTKMLNEKIELLKYKKQIILQGPPGTGKTRMAKMMAQKMTSPITSQNPLNIIEDFFKNYKDTDLESIKKRQTIKSTLENFQTRFPISSLKELSLDDYCVGKGNRDNFCWWIETGLKDLGRYSPGKANHYLIYYSNAKGAYSKNGALVKDIDNDEDAMKMLASILFEVVSNKDFEKGSKYFGDSFLLKIFNSYYPDEYFPINGRDYLDNVLSILGVDSRSMNKGMKNLKLNQEFNRLREKYKNDMSPFEFMSFLFKTFNLKEGIETIEDKKVINKGETKLIQFHPSYSYEDFVRGITANINGNNQVEYKVENKSLSQFAERALDNPSANYVLIIDEINRANLSSVLGELIYALEYRFDPENPNETTVDSMYSIADPDGTSESYEEGKKLKLPTNLFIIGTMNTADRSVGHIDYAIRRRFAFVDVLPTTEPLKPFALPYFKTVSDLFVKNYDTIDWNNPKPESSEYLATDFRPEDVWIGHSYFIAENEAELKIKLQYEVKPILKEYLKDGILLESAKDIIYGIS